MNRIFFVLFLFIFLIPLAAFAVEEDETVVKTVDGLRFDVPEDRPIEKRHGIVAPMQLDKYVAIKFAKAEDRLYKIEDSINEIREDLILIKEDIKLLKEKANPLRSK